MSKEELKQFLAAKHSIEASQKPGMVYQVWEDGEITLQKSYGNEYCIALNLDLGNLDKELMPIVDGEHGYVFCQSREDAFACREAIREFLNLI